MKIYTIKDIAKKSGVGIATVSRVLNNRPDVSEETKKKVMDVVELYHYTPNNNARYLKRRNTDLISLIVRGRQNSFLDDLAERIINCGREAGQNFLLDFIDEKGDEFEAARMHIAEKKVRAIIFLGSNIISTREDIEGLHVPCVFATVDTSGLKLPSVSSVSVDNQASAKLAIDHLLDQGHRRIAVFGGKRDILDGIGRRYLGVLQSFEDRGLVFDESLYVESSFRMEKAYQTAQEFLDQEPDCTAIFAMGDTMAIGIIRALFDRGIRVPEHCSIIGFDGIALSQFLVPTLTTVAQPADELARESVSLALRLMDDPQDSENVTLQSALVPGASVRMLA